MTGQVTGPVSGHVTGRGVILAAPTSGSGKTTLTLGILRALTRRGIAVRGAKSGPDYLDPQFHAAATGRPCVNLDAWAMSKAAITSRAQSPDLILIEGAMGLFDGAPPAGKGAVADLARLLRLPVVLIVDAGHMAQSIAPLVAGFARHDPTVRIAGLILNKVGSERHLRMLHSALAPIGIPVLGALMRDADLALPSRHLGLVQATEHAHLDSFLDTAADRVEARINLDQLIGLAAPLPAAQPEPIPHHAPATLALARDAAFGFCYAHQIADWETSGTKILPFSPLADDPVPEADRVFLPGGYPELYAETLSGNRRFLDSLRTAAKSVPIYGECGGYMVLGESLTNAAGETFRMAGLLGLRSSFANRRLHLGYRSLQSLSPLMLGSYTGHEFHYATTLEAQGQPLFAAQDAEGADLPPMGLTEGWVAGSFAHIIDKT